VDPVWRRKLYLDVPDGNSKKQQQGRAKQKLGALSNQEMQARPSKGKTQPKPQRRQGQRVVSLLKWPEIQKGPGTYKEALNNINIAIFEESYPEVKLNEDDQKYILEELGKLLRRTPLEDLPQLSPTNCRKAHLFIYSPTNSLVSGLQKLLTITGWEQGPG
jgi:hypothetical protein